MKTSTFTRLALALAASISFAVPSISLAQQKSCHGGNCLSNMCDKVRSCARKSTVYLSNYQKLYFSQEAAKQMKFIDFEGNPLVKAHKIPADFRDGSSAAEKPSEH